MKLMFKCMFLFLAGGVIYYFLEILFRGRSHTAMIAVGGTCFILCGLLNEVMDWKTPLALQMLICTYYGGGIYKRHCIEYMAET